MVTAAFQSCGPLPADLESVSHPSALEISMNRDLYDAGIAVRRAFGISPATMTQVLNNSWSTQSVQMPFGGHKLSGYGREKGIEALDHYSHMKSISIRLIPR
jgi:hypothetical protein